MQHNYLHIHNIYMENKKGKFKDRGHEKEDLKEIK